MDPLTTYFCYERGPKGWVPKIYWNEKPSEVKRGKGDTPFRSKLHDVTHIAKLYKPTSGDRLMFELTETYKPPEEPDYG